MFCFIYDIKAKISVHGVQNSKNSTIGEDEYSRISSVSAGIPL